ncbi:MAG: urease accessory protein UreD [Eubacteriales bacterium]|nr:urease accessory protein UreD [Eubacteriales bacterium]
MENPFGKVSRVSLTAGPKEGRTILEDVGFTAPFKIMQPFYEERMRVMLMSASAGILAGDCQEFHIWVKKGASMEFFSQSYEKIHKMNEGCAKRMAKIRVEDGGELIYRPLPTIPFAQSAFESRLQVELGGTGAKMMLQEVLSCGRAASGERFAYRFYYNLVEVRREGRLIYLDNTRFEPERFSMEETGMYEGATHLANLVLFGYERDEEWFRKVRELVDGTEGVFGGASRLAEGDVVVRMLGGPAQKLEDLLEVVREL